jgi:hypothetical protein
MINRGRKCFGMPKDLESVLAVGAVEVFCKFLMLRKTPQSHQVYVADCSISWVLSWYISLVWCLMKICMYSARSCCRDFIQYNHCIINIIVTVNLCVQAMCCCVLGEGSGSWAQMNVTNNPAWVLVVTLANEKRNWLTLEVLCVVDSSKCLGINCILQEPQE